MRKRRVNRKTSRRKTNILDERIEHFSKEVEAIGKGTERKGGEWESWFHRTFGIVGPLISSIFGLLILALVILLMNFMNVRTGIPLFSDIGLFLFDSISWFFLIFLFFSYTSYFSRGYPKAYVPFSPIVTALGIAIAFWLAVRVINITNLYLGIPMLSVITFHVEKNLFLIFLFVLLLGYLVLSLKVSSEKPLERAFAARRGVKSSVSRRLYRSGKDKILGGVCGGIAEYLGVDPVIIRLLWVIAILAWGSGILAYIIAWIIIPRNPKHEWK